METDKKRGKTGRLESLVAGAVLMGALALSALSTGCTEPGYYAIRDEKTGRTERVSFKRWESTSFLNVREGRTSAFGPQYPERNYVDFRNNSTVDVYTIKDQMGTTTYYAASPNPVDKKMIAIAQGQFDAYLSKIAEIQTLK